MPARIYVTDEGRDKGNERNLLEGYPVTVRFKSDCADLFEHKERKGHLKTKSIRADVSEDDGLRICIMRSYNPEKHPDYKPIDQHWIELSPPPELLEDYQKGLSWQDYLYRFTQEVLIYQTDRIRELAELATKKDITLLCYEETPDNCHRSIIAKLCKMHQPGLEVILE